MWRSCYRCQTLFSDNRRAKEGVEVTARLHGEGHSQSSVAPGACDPCLEEMLREASVPALESHSEAPSPMSFDVPNVTSVVDALITEILCPEIVPSSMQEATSGKVEHDGWADEESDDGIQRPNFWSQPPAS